MKSQSIRRNTRLALSIALLMVILLALPGTALAAPGDTTRVSVDSSGAQADDTSSEPSISADGRYVAFYSLASNLVAGDTNATFDVFVRDRTTGATTRASVATGGGEANGLSLSPAISSDGRYVAFESYATNLVAGDTNGQDDIFVHDMTTGTTTRASVDSSGTQSNGVSMGAAISSDGRYVGFYSSATNLVAGDTNASSDVFVHDMITGATTRVSVDSSGTQANGFSSSTPSFSSDGRYVAFASDASNLVTGDTNASSDVFVHDMTTGATTRVSVDSSGTQGNNVSGFSSISADGRYVAFGSSATNLVAGDTNASPDIFVHDMTTGATTRVSVDSSGVEGNSTSADASISPDGRYVAFHSQADNLVTGDTNSRWDVFVHDRTTGITTRVSVDSSGAQGNGGSVNPSISSYGRYVAFGSDATNLVTGDTNARNDIFVNERNFTYPTVIFGTSSVPPTDGAILTVGPSALLVQFNKDVLSDGSQHAANSVQNYVLLRPGPNGVFDTTITSPGICDSAHATVSDDVKVSINSITYDAATFTATLNIGPADAPLANGQYRLYACGAASIWDLSSNALNGGTNTAINFTVASVAAVPVSVEASPATGFAPNRVTVLPPQTVSYASMSGLWLEIPKLGVRMNIVGVPQTNGTWDVKWLGKDAGWLNGTAFPTWIGNSAITGHVTDSNGQPGPFAQIKNLSYGDQVIVHLYGEKYIFEVRNSRMVRPSTTGFAFEHLEVHAYLTLITCQGYNPFSDSYLFRRIVRAVLVEVK